MKVTILFLPVLALLLACNSNRPQSDRETPKPVTTFVDAKTADTNLVPPDVVRLEKVMVKDGVKRLTLSNSEGIFVLACGVTLPSCVTPAHGVDYQLFNSRTKWRFPEGKGFITLEFLQDWTGSYDDKENIGLIPAVERSPIGMYWLESWVKR